MKQLLAWLFHHYKRQQTSDRKEALEVAQAAQDQLMKDLLEGDLNVSWYSNVRMPSTRLTPSAQPVPSHQDHPQPHQHSQSTEASRNQRRLRKARGSPQLLESRHRGGKA